MNENDEAMQSGQASAPKRAPRRSRPLLSRPFLLVAAFASALLSVGMHQAAPALAAAVEQRFIQGPGRNTVAQRGAGGIEGALHDDVRRLAMGLDRASRSTAPMQRLMPLDDQRVAIPQDLALYAAEVEQFARQPVHVSGSGSTLFLVCDSAVHADVLADAIGDKVGVPAVSTVTGPTPVEEVDGEPRLPHAIAGEAEDE